MAPLFNRLLSIDDVQKRVGQFKSEVEKLLSQEGSARLRSYDMHNLQRRCTDLKKLIDGYIKKAEAMKVDVRNAGMADLKEHLLQQLDNLSDDLAMLINPNHIRKPPRIVGETTEEEVGGDNREGEENVYESSKGNRSGEGTSNVEENGTGCNNINAEQQDQHDEYRSPFLNSSRGVHIGGNLFLVIADFQAEHQSDLSVKAGEVVIIHATRKDGWWMAERSDGKQGLVPKTFLKVYSKACLPPQERVLVEVHKAAIASSSTTPSTQEERKILAQNYAKGEDVRSKNDIQNEQNVVLRDDEIPETVSGAMAATSTEERMRSMPEKMTEQKKTIQQFRRNETCLGAAVSNDAHLSYRCHFAPRLSESNVGFHDLYWNYERNMLRKRRVRVSKIFRLLHVQNVPTNITGVHSRLIRICLFDLTGRTGRQVVSNVHTIKAQAKPRDEQTWTFISKTDGEHSGIEFSDFFIRSNYIQTDVVILIEVSVVHSDANAEVVETSLGYATLPIIGDSGHCCLQNKTYTHALLSGNFFEKNSADNRPAPRTTQIKLALRVSDVNETIVSFVDSLPDILIWNPMFARLGFYYRRSLGELLLKQRDNPMSGELICDPFLATFPIVAEQLDVMDLVRSLWMEKMKSYGNKKGEESEETAHFREVYVNTAFVLCAAIPMPKFDLLNPQALAERLAILKAFKEQYVTSTDPLKRLSTHRCKPVDIFAQTVDLVGRHAID